MNKENVFAQACCYLLQLHSTAQLLNEQRVIAFLKFDK